MTGGVPPIRSELTQPDGALGRDWSVFFSFLGQMAIIGSGIVRSGTRTARLALDQSKVPDNSIFFEDTGLVYQSLVNATTNARYWHYIAGKWTGVQADLPTLGTVDTGVIADVTDFSHTLKWSGSAWAWAPGENGSGYISFFEIDPTGTGWHLVDGTANVPYLKADGTTALVTLPDLTSAGNLAAVLVLGGTNGGPNAATGPTVGNTLSTDAASTGITIPAQTGLPSANSPVQSGAGINVASSTHTHAEGPITDPQHSHGLSGAVSVGSDAMPRNLVRRPFFRQ